MSNIRIDGEFVDARVDGGYVVSEGRREWSVFASREDAGKEARGYWADMADNDPTEFRHMVGDESLVQWALGRYAGPGSTRVRSLDAWLDLWLDTPDEHFASYDGEEREVTGPTADERARAFFVQTLDKALEFGGACTEGSLDDCFQNVGICVGAKTYWIMEEGYKGAHGTRFTDTPDGDAIHGDMADLREALESDEIRVFVDGWDALVEELGFTPTVAYRSN